MINHLCVIGVGLIGGSLALSLKKSGYVKQITGLGRSIENLQKAKQLGIIDNIETDYERAVSKADLIFVAVPIGAMSSVFGKIAPHLQVNTIVTDGGSAKQTIIDIAIDTLGEKINQFVPGHPIAGTEKSGAEAAFDSLYINRRVILTPVEENSQQNINKVCSMWQASGAEVDEMDAKHHDMVLAGTSHLPHVLAFALVDCLNNVNNVDEIFKYAAGGFRDFTRIASSDPVMWRDICVNNSDAILEMMHKYQAEINSLKSAIQSGDSDKLLEIFTNAKHARDTLCT